jgi:hypothetical protein
MVWRESFLDLILIPLSLLLPMLYHAWLYRAVRRHPLSTAFGIYSASRRVWISGMMKVRAHHLFLPPPPHRLIGTALKV